MPSVALETTLLLHGLPTEQSLPVYDELAAIVRAAGASPRAMAVFNGALASDLSRCQLEALLAGPPTPKINTSTLGSTIHGGGNGATTVSTTMELAAAVGIRIFATGGLGGVHKGFAEHLDISADLAAFARFPVAVVTSGCKSILDVAATREQLETLGVPVIGYRTSEFPAFYSRRSGLGVDARFDEPRDLGRFLIKELCRTNRGVVVANPIPQEAELDDGKFAAWLAQAEQEASARGVVGRAVTPYILGALHRISDGATLRANIALVKSNAKLAAELAVAMA